LPARIVVTSTPLHSAPLSPLIYGDFIEFLNDLIPGMRAEKVQDRSFEGIVQPNEVWPPGENWVYPRWQPFVAGRPRPDRWPETAAELEPPAAVATLELDSARPFVGRHSARVRATGDAGKPFVAGIAQRGIAVKRGQPLHVELFLRVEEDHTGPVHVLLGRNYVAFFHAYAALEFDGVTGEWSRFAGSFTPDAADEDATLAIGISGEGTLWIDKVSLLPDDHRHGWRPDVVEAVHAMKPGILRFGGSSLIYYQWQDGIGPQEQRVPFSNQPWGNIEENDVGLHEFLQFCELVEAEPLICLNANSSTVQQVLDEIEYCSGPVDSPFGRIRAAMGHPEPFRVRYWQIGNEQSGSEYERILLEYARAIRARYPDLALLASYPSESIIRDASEAVDYVCPHFYAPYTAAGEAEIRSLIARIDQHAKNPALKLAMTEWNHTAGHWGWGRAWLLTLYNALNAARMLNMYQRLGDKVRIANRSNLINSCCSGVIQTSRSDLYVTPCYHVQKAYANFAGDIALRVESEPGDILDLAATRQPATGEIALLGVNPTAQEQEREIDLSQLGLSGREFQVWTLTGPSLDAVNSFQEKDRVAPYEARGALPASVFTHRFPAYSVSILRFR
jgi:alpha-L-arabinofuranosidase